MNHHHENAWNTLMQGSKFPWWEWDIRVNAVRFNDLKAAMLGYDPADFRGRGYQAFTELLHPDDYDKTMNAMMAVLRGETGLYQIDYRIKSIRQDYLWYMDRGIVAEKDGGGKPLVIRGIVIDLGREASRGTNVDALLSLIYSAGAVASGRTSLLVICSSCKKARKEREVWISLPDDLDVFIEESVSHGICPQCIRDLYPDFADEVLRELGKR